MVDGMTLAGARRHMKEWSKRNDRYVSPAAVCRLALRLLKNRNWQPETREEWIEYICEVNDARLEQE